MSAAPAAVCRAGLDAPGLDRVRHRVLRPAEQEPRLPRSDRYSPRCFGSGAPDQQGRQVPIGEGRLAMLSSRIARLNRTAVSRGSSLQDRVYADGPARLPGIGVEVGPVESGRESESSVASASITRS